MDSDVPTDDDLKKLREEVAAFPTDLRRRFELGAALFKHRKYSEAIPEFQKAQGNPHTRLQAMRFLADIYEARGMFDLAARVREQLSKESGDEGSSGSAPVPAPTRPVAPRDSSRAKKSPDEDAV